MNDQEPKIRISLSEIHAKPPLRALADVTLYFSTQEITLRRCTVFHKTGEPPWANLPGISIEKNGKKQFVLLIELSRDLKKRVLEFVLDEYRRKANGR